MTNPLDTSLARLDREIAEKLAADGTPGLSLAITDRARTLAVRCYGKSRPPGEHSHYSNVGYKTLG
jgi:CubicO group peptidase (beta-lactamase class C family)